MGEDDILDEETPKFCIDTKVDTQYNKEITFINLEAGKVYSGEDTDYDKGESNKNLFPFTISN